MPYDIRSFEADVRRTGILRDNRFEVQLAAPNALRGVAGMLTEAGHATLTCEAAVLPGVTIADDKVRRYGYGVIQKKPVGAMFTDAEFVFRCGEDGRVYDFLHAWQQVVVNFEHRQGINVAGGLGPSRYPQELNYLRDYAVDITVTAFNQRHEPAIRVILRDAWPIHVGDVTVAWAARGNYVRIPATFTYMDWFRDTSLADGGDTIGAI